ncbi:hypothetical protein BKA83DRAFT_4496063 [Pisolithus microcarpus]|nr:hypothetical protein BKA83DRAFT_4496063 [Pisolithus microcarpus]
MSEVDDNDELSNTGHNDAGSHLPQTAKVLQVTAMTNVTAKMLAKKPWTNPCSDTMAEGSGIGHVHYINGHLPPLLQEDRKWTKQVLPALVTWAGSLGDPWVIPDQDLMRALWMIIITVNPNFGNLTAIHPGALVFILATWQLSVWHNNFSSTTLANMAHFLASATDHMQPPSVWETCNELLDGLTFLYQDLDPSKPENAY